LGLGRGIETESDLVGQLDLDALEMWLGDLGWIGVEMERDEQGWPRAWGKRPSGESSLPGLERGQGNAFLSTEGGDGQAADGLPLEALLPEAFEVGVFGACHELAPGLVEEYQPNSITTVARLVLPSAYGAE
jgi:hypothetical protein